jgi:NADPH:quinone reductase-like Zn-dependent oxidoreductase
MKAAVCRRYGSPDAVTVEEVPTPRPRDDEILVRVRAAIVDGLARRGRSAPPPSSWPGTSAL